MRSTEQADIVSLARKLLIAGDPNRLKIVCLLFKDEDACVSEIGSELGASVAAVSHHLRALAAAGFLEPEREGKRVRYRLVRSAFNADFKRFVCRNARL